ncbi:MAG: hypothetical protein ACR2OZ_08030 [Verrucomicrobiales bacterium]
MASIGPESGDSGGIGEAESRRRPDVKTLFSPGRRTAVLSLVWLLLIVRGDLLLSAPLEPSAQSAAVTEALQTSFASATEAVTAFKPFYLTGDFNGDGAQDIVIVVRIKARRTALPQDVRIMNPFYNSPKVNFPVNPAAENKLALAIIHSWKTPETAAKLLLVGEAPVVAFAYVNTSSPESAKNVIQLMSKSGKRRKGQTFPRTAKGDVILLATEVGSDGPLYWNGKTYRWEEPEGD